MKSKLKFSLQYVVSVTRLCVRVCHFMDCSPPGSVREILQARILEWAAIPFSRGSSRPRDWTLFSCVSGKLFTIWAGREAPQHVINMQKKQNKLLTRQITVLFSTNSLNYSVELYTQLIRFRHSSGVPRASQVAPLVKNLLANTGDVRCGFDPCVGMILGGGHGNPLQYSCLENPMDWGAWQARVHGVAKSQTWLKRLSMHGQVLHSLPGPVGAPLDSTSSQMSQSGSTWPWATRAERGWWRREGQGGVRGHC